MSDPGRCPLCGGPNACAMAAGADGCDACWCRDAEIPRAVLDRVPAEARGRACVCRDCARGAGGTAGIVPPAAASGMVLLAAALASVLGTRDARASGLEAFATDPAARGWRVAGDASLFRWDAARGALAVTWDSRRANSFFALPLPAPLTKADDFAFGFTLRLDSVRTGIDPAKPGTFEIAAGLLNLAQASSPGFERGVFLRSTNLVEWTWFPAAEGISASVSPAIVPSDGRLPWGFSDSFLVLAPGVDYAFRLVFTASDGTLRPTVTVDGAPGPELAPVVLPAGFADFSVDALSVNSYSDAGQDPRFAGSVLATGWIDDVTWELPPPPVGAARIRGDGGVVRVTAATRAGWKYVLEASPDLAGWATVSAPVDGTGGDVEFRADGGTPGPARFFRVRAAR